MKTVLRASFLFLILFIKFNSAGDWANLEEDASKEKGGKLLDAVVQGDCQRLSLLLNDYTVQGSGLLCLAIVMKKMHIAKLLISHNIDINAMFDNLWPLQLAVETENRDLIELLLKSGAGVNAIDLYGSTVLHFLPDSGSDICRTLIKAGACPTIANMAGLTPLHNAAIKGFSNIISELVSCPEIVIDAKDCHGRTPLHHSLLHSKEEAALRLIESGASVKIVSKFNEGLLDIADDNGLFNAKRELLKRGAYSHQLPYGSIYDDGSCDLTFMIGRIAS